MICQGEDMDIREKVIRYLTEKYNPESIIIYGSFADGTESEHSDFDALVIAESDVKHDSSVIDKTVLDVFVYPPETFERDFRAEDFVQIFDGIAVFDKNGLASELKNKVLQYLDSQPKKTDEEKASEVGWCRKMLERTVREDCEGYYRRHLLLTESLEIYCDIKEMPWRGPKKAVAAMKRTDPQAYGKYFAALKDASRENLSNWVEYLEQSLIEKRKTEQKN